MATKSTDWRPGPTVCRCCLTEGCYKDISTEYFWMGKREVYAEMLSDTFNVSISYSKSGGPNSNSRLICEPCISRLRDASDFRRQVLECEKTFMQHLDPGSSSVSIEVENIIGRPLGNDVKLERVKLEKSVSDDDDEFDCGFPDDDDDDLDDQPLTTLASKIPKKETVDIMDLLDNAKAAEKRKSTTKLKSSPTKKTKIVKKEVKLVKPGASKTTTTVEKKKKDVETNPIDYAKWNAQTIVQYTTVLPFKLPNSSMVCVYCYDRFDQPSRFREHMNDSHKVCNVKVAFTHVGWNKCNDLKADCTDIKCRICSEPLDSIKTAAKHLKQVHNKHVYLNHGICIHPFILGDDKLTCGVCEETFSQIRTLSRHLQRHTLQSTCDLCGKSFANNSNLKKHLENSCPYVSKQKRCIKCKFVFDTTEDRRKHLQDSVKCRLYLCSECGERFMKWEHKQRHMNEVHGVPIRVYKCPECDMVFPDSRPLRIHFRIVHSNNHYVCTHCGLKWETKYLLQRHSIVHSKERTLSCDVCKKTFTRKSAVVAHMWIHSEVKRFKCKVCKKTFNQKFCFKTHMKSYHPGVEDFT